MVGLYGDPTVSWSILLEARLREAVDPAAVRTRLAEAVATHPHLGLAPAVRAVRTADWHAVRTEFADRRYADSEPLIRVAAGDDILLLAAHHGVVDGFGLLALLGLALDVPVASSATGIGDRPAARTFASSAVTRLLEALFAPPSRAASSQTTRLTGDAIAVARIPAAPAGTAALTSAAARAVRTWNHRYGVPTPRVVAAVGASRRPGTRLHPDRRTAFFRLRVPPDAPPGTIRRLLDRTAPEPDFPPSQGALVRPAIRALSSRLGATFLVSNLGVVTTSDLVRSVAFQPAASGRSGIAVGAVTCGEITTVTVRARRTSFDDAAARQLLKLIVASLEA